LATFVERARWPSAGEAQFDHLALALGERPQDFSDPLAQQPLVGVLAGADRPVVAQELFQRPLASRRPARAN